MLTPEERARLASKLCADSAYDRGVGPLGGATYGNLPTVAWCVRGWAYLVFIGERRDRDLEDPATLHHGAPGRGPTPIGGIEARNRPLFHPADVKVGDP